MQSVSGPVSHVEDVRDLELQRVIAENLTVLPYGPRELNCSYDRSCNLSCPSCRTHLILEQDRKTEIQEIQQKLHREALPDARLLYITGSGDPFGSPHFKKWLQTMKRNDMPKLQVIHLHTNALLWTARIWQTLAEDVRELIKYADISIDAARHVTYAMNRRGGKFDLLLENLEFISTLRKDGPLEWLGINMVVQENNFEEMLDFVRLGKRFQVDTVYFHQLANWGTFSQDEYLRRAIHLETHPRHTEFAQLLQDKMFDDPMVELTNLADIKSNKLCAR